ncbi:MAG: leucine-rich repeat protein [Clostridia bacterium]|nr:leucine-rich repeat protein [Clostridia bacterium]
MAEKRLLRLACSLLALLVPLALTLFAFALPAQYSRTWLGGLPLKLDALEAAPAPRIVVIGGSGAAFNTRCELLEEAFPGYRAVNLGLYAGLGTTVMLELALPRLQPGDLVVFSPELSPQTLSDWFGAETMWQAADGRADLLAALSGDRLGAMAAAFPGFAGGKARLFFTGDTPAGDGIYARSSFTPRGDVSLAARPQNRMAEGWDAAMPLSADPEQMTDAFAARVNAFAAACEARGVRVFFRFCAMNEAAMPPEAQQRLPEVDRRAAELLEVPFLGSTAEALMPAGWFYDTNFHLNSAGAAADTAALAEALSAAAGLPMAKAPAVPDMPALSAVTTVAGESGDEACFLYQETETGFVVTGVTAQGLQRARLTVPAAHSGKPVTGFTAEAFAGLVHLEELVLQENITAIPDGAFAGCTGLRRLVLTSRTPAGCSVGADLLRGTGAEILVPADRVSAYCTDYFWARYAARIRGSAREAGTEPAPAATAVPAPAAARGIRYEGNGGHLRYAPEEDSLTVQADHAHLRRNTLQGTAYFQREGYVLTGWNTAPDGAGLSVGLGSRVDPSVDTLWACWEAAAPAEAFRFHAGDRGVCIDEWLGTGSVCVVPESLEGLPVREIAAGAFTGCHLTRLVLPSSLRTVEAGAFRGGRLETLVLFDGITAMGDAAFDGCDGPACLRINACVSPVFGTSYYAVWADAHDRLLSLQGQRKLVLFSGSSGRYGYDAEALARAFPGWEPVNLGVYAYTNARPLADLILPLTEAGDVLLSAPEFDAIPEQFCVSHRLDHHFWAMMEADYDMAAALDMRAYTGVFDSLGETWRIRSGMAAGDYSQSPNGYDDEGNRYPYATYDRYGDFILPRPNRDSDERQHANMADYTPESFPEETLAGLNRVYRRFLDRGVRVYFTYTPRNASSLTPESTPEKRRALHRLLCDALCVPVISELEDSLLPGRYFWKIDSHPSTEGAAIRTRQVIRDLTRAAPDMAQP